MKLLEHQAKTILSSHGISVPRGIVITRADEIMELKAPVVIKAQVPIGGRGKAGGIKSAGDIIEARTKAQDILGMTISGYSVREVLVETRLTIERELYLSIVLDRTGRLPLLMVSQRGGMDVESVPAEDIGRWHIHPFIGVEDYLSREVGYFLELDPVTMGEMKTLLQRCWSVFREMDCELLEMNPLAITSSRDLVAADAKITISDDALFRHPELSGVEEGITPLENEARSKGIAFVQLDGNIGVIANGAGLTMATLDNISLYGGRGGAFLDLGGTDDPRKVEEAFELLLKAKPRVILLNIFGGITRCDTVAEGLIAAVKRLSINTPIVARIRGVNEERARDMLLRAGIQALTGLDQAAQIASELGGRP